MGRSTTGVVARSGSGELIALATRAFATAILDKSHLRKKESLSLQSLHTYASTIHQLSHALLSSKAFFRIEVAAAILSMAMVELMLPASDHNSLAHFGGISALINLFTPESFTSDDSHAIFVGCRPVLLFQALKTRRSTFIGEERWMTIPFRNHPPSDMQILVGDAATLPYIMQELDLLRILPRDAATPKADRLEGILLETLGRLSKWNNRLELMQTRLTPVVHSSQATDLDIWFPNLFEANIHTHMWAFQILGLIELGDLNSILSNDRDDSFSRGAELQRLRDAQIQSFASRICQSITYLLQDEMKLYGPTAALFPLKIAYEVFIKDEQANRAQIERCWRIFSQLRDRGLWSAPLYPTEH